METKAKRETEAEKKNGVVLALLDNLFFAAKINQATELAGFEVVYVKNADQGMEKALATIPRLIIVDLNANTGDPLILIKGLKSDEQLKNIPVIGFVSHVNVELQELARTAGCDRVMARSAFEQSLIRLLNGMRRDNETKETDEKD
ncbi:MAG: response regulator [Acidobacteria bacterium]|nr:response regulator [Acidobacteriota bacterium]